MKNSLLLVYISAFTVILNSCNEDTHVQAVSYLTGNITGKIYLSDKSGNRLTDLSGVSVQLSGVKSYTTTTSTDGSYSFEKVDQGVYTLTASKHNYYTQIREGIQFTGNGTLKLQELPLFYMFGVSVRISVSIIDEAGKPNYDSSGVVLTLSNDKGFSTTINNRINVHLDSLPQGTYSIKVEKDGFIYDQSGFTSAGRVLEPITLRIFRVLPNNKIVINSPKYQLSTTLNNGRIDSSLIITFDTQTSKNVDTLYYSFINLVSDTSAFYSWENTLFSMGRMQKKNLNQFSFSLHLEKKAGESNWHVTPNNTSINQDQLFFYVKTYPELLSSAHRNTRYPFGYYRYASAIVPFSVP